MNEEKKWYQMNNTATQESGKLKELAGVFCSSSDTKDEYIKKYGNYYSNLYILRKDVFWCRGIDPKTGVKISADSGAPFASFILINVLFNYAVYLSGLSYTDYIKKLFPVSLSAIEQKVLNHLRNALVHQSYNLKWEPRPDINENGKTTFFAMAEDADSLLVEKIDETDADESWLVNIAKLHQAVEGSISELYESAKNDDGRCKEILSRSSEHTMHVVSKDELIKYKLSKHP